MSRMLHRCSISRESVDILTAYNPANGRVMIDLLNSAAISEVVIGEDINVDCPQALSRHNVRVSGRNGFHLGNFIEDLAQIRRLTDEVLDLISNVTTDGNLIRNEQQANQRRDNE